MKRRSKKFYFFNTLLIAVIVWVALAFFNTGGLKPAVDITPESDIYLARAADMPGVSCEPKRIPVRLSKDSRFVFDLVGQLCWQGGRLGDTLQVLVSGAGYGSAYWDFPYKPDTYSYMRRALAAGDAVFNFDRLGMGASDHPPGALLDVDTQAYVLYQALDALKVRRDFGAVVVLGHSFGSVIALAHALNYPEQIDGLVLTGYAHNVNPEFGPSMGKGIEVAAFGHLAGQIYDPTYLITKENSRGSSFYTGSNTDEQVIATDDLTRETTAVGELITMSKYFADQSKGLTLPVLMIVGDEDFVVCGGELDCKDHDAVIANEAEYFPPEACLALTVLADTNHNANLHRNAPETFSLMLEWIAARVGSGGIPATDPCIPDAA